MKICVKWQAARSDVSDEIVMFYNAKSRLGFYKQLSPLDFEKH